MVELKKVDEIVEQNFNYAYILDCYGIEFYECYDQYLGKVCEKKGISISKLLNSLQEANNSSSLDLSKLQSYPVELVIEYLKHAHYVFLKKRLPYMAKLINRLKEYDYSSPALIKDLKFVFPLFVEDFIHHIYEEEDELFSYLIDLAKVEKNEMAFSRIFGKMEQISLNELAQDHHDADDEMRGIRRITKDYTFGLKEDLHLRTIYRELRQFEKELVYHAKVENMILFPKALQLEGRIKEEISKKIALN